MESLPNDVDDDDELSFLNVGVCGGAPTPRRRVVRREDPEDSISFSFKPSVPVPAVASGSLPAITVFRILLCWVLMIGALTIDHCKHWDEVLS